MPKTDVLSESIVRETLVALIEDGPVWDGDLPSKIGRDRLVECGYALHCVYLGQDGYTAATYSGRDAYNAFYNSNTLKEAHAERLKRIRSAWPFDKKEVKP